MLIVTSVNKFSSVFVEHGGTVIFAGMVFVKESMGHLKEDALEFVFAATNFPLND